MDSLKESIRLLDILRHVAIFCSCFASNHLPLEIHSNPCVGISCNYGLFPISTFSSSGPSVYFSMPFITPLATSLALALTR